MADRGQELVMLNVDIKAVTAKAILIDTGDGIDVWLPKSQIQLPENSPYDDSDEIEKGDELTILIPEWLAYEKCLD